MLLKIKRNSTIKTFLKMTKEDFEIIVKPLDLLDEPYKTFMKGALLGNFLNWEKVKEEINKL